MIDLQFELFTAQTAVNAGLIEAIKRGESISTAFLTETFATRFGIPSVSRRTKSEIILSNSV